MKKVWVSSPRFTGQVDLIDDDYLIAHGGVWGTQGTIINAPPVWRKFVGQRFDNLVAWLRKFGKLEITAL